MCASRRPVSRACDLHPRTTLRRLPAHGETIRSFLPVELAGRVAAVPRCYPWIDSCKQWRSLVTKGTIRIFISSTIRDLADVRSALRYWLEELGFDVLLTELNDFDRDPTGSTFDACLDAIRTCDYYILLVGSRTGGEYEPGVSITNQEFRVACELEAERHLAIIPFIRTEVHAALPLSDDEAAQTLMRDAYKANPEKARANIASVRRFWEEVSQRRIPSSPPRPAGTRFYNKFSTFKDLADALKIQLRAVQTVRRRALLAQLLEEIRDNIQVCNQVHKGLPIPVHRVFTEVRNDPTLADSRAQHVILTRGQADRIYDFRFGSSGAAANLSSAALVESLHSGEFVVFDQELRGLVEDPVRDGMSTLLVEITRSRDLAVAYSQSPFAEEFGQILGFLRGREQRANVSDVFLTFLFALHDRLENVLRLSVAFAHWIEAEDGAPFEMPPLHPSAPDPLIAEEIERERPRATDVRSWLANRITCDLMTGLSAASPSDCFEAIEAFPELAAQLERQVQASFGMPIAELTREILERSARDGTEAALIWLRSFSEGSPRQAGAGPEAESGLGPGNA